MGGYIFLNLPTCVQSQKGTLPMVRTEEDGFTETGTKDQQDRQCCCEPSMAMVILSPCLLIINTFHHFTPVDKHHPEILIS